MDGSVEYLDGYTRIVPARDDTIIDPFADDRTPAQAMLAGKERHKIEKQVLPTRPVPQIAAATEPHQHNYSSISGRRVLGTDKAVLYRECVNCPEQATQAFEMGSRQAMAVLYQKLRGDDV